MSIIAPAPAYPSTSISAPTTAQVSEPTPAPISIDLIHNTKENTFKIFLKPIIGRSGNLAMLLKSTYKRVLSGRHHYKLFGSKVDRDNLPDGYEHSIIENIQQLFNKLCGSENNATFTYCYKPSGRLYLCKTFGKNDDPKCKHTWLCNQARNIVSAGIVQFSKANETVYVDNMSGTYKTQQSNLESFEDDFERSFPGIKIELITSPNIDKKSKERYCNVMNNNSVDFYKLCPKSEKVGGRKRKTKKKLNRKSNKKSNKKLNKKLNRKTNRKINKLKVFG